MTDDDKKLMSEMAECLQQQHRIIQKLIAKLAEKDPSPATSAAVVGDTWPNTINALNLITRAGVAVSR